MKWAVPLSVFILLLAAVWPSQIDRDSYLIGSKKFVESVILGEILTQLGRRELDSAQQKGLTIVHRERIGGTGLLFESLKREQIDAYPDYTGTIRQELYRDRNLPDDQALVAALAEDGIAMSKPLGFSNNYAIAVSAETARELQLSKISDLAAYPQLRFAFTNEFLQRADGWPGLRTTYNLPQSDVKGVVHELAYELLESQQVDGIEVFTTDAKIDQFDIVLLEDDQNHFPEYEAVILANKNHQDDNTPLWQAIERLESSIETPVMRAMNAERDIQDVSEPRIASQFLAQTLGIKSEPIEETDAQMLWRTTREHLHLVRRSMALGILFGIPLGIWAAKRRWAGHVILSTVGIVQTIPALALLVVLIQPTSSLGLETTGVDSAPAILALFLYSLLPIVRGVHTGLKEIPVPLQESAEALGLSWWAQLWKVELPLALPIILAGIKTAAVIIVGFATLGALIGAGGYGAPILEGIDIRGEAGNRLILLGAIPAAVLALLIHALFDLVEKFAVPRQLRER